jgi:putative phosphoesterase
VVRLGLISDVHGNLRALDAVVAELETAGVDELVCLGDLGPGPQPAETIQRLRELGCPVVRGNWDEWLLAGAPPLPGPAGPKLAAQSEWWTAQLGPGERAFLRGLPAAVERVSAPLEVLCVHGSPRSNREDIHATTPDLELEAMLDGSQPGVLAAGHTHLQLVRPHESTLVVNPGSVGLPFRSRPLNGEVHMSPWAEYAILTIEGRRVSTELRRAPYDVAGLLELTVAVGMPHARWWVDCWLRDEGAGP